MKAFSINGRFFHSMSPPYVVAEIGNNHGGDPVLCAEMIKVAKDCGADAVKLQMRDNKSLYTKTLYDTPYLNRNSYGRTYGEHREVLELSYGDVESLQEIAKDVGIDFFSTAFDMSSADKLIAMAMPVIKIASGGLTNTPLIEHCAKSGIPMIISTGGAGWSDVDRVYKMLKGYPVAFLHCVATYPNKPEEVNLNVIAKMIKWYDAVIGYSCHYNGIVMAAGAYMEGARIIEKHFTLNHTFKGTDHALSLEPPGFESMCHDLKRLHQAKGDGVKRVLEAEIKPIRKMSHSIYVAKGVKEGLEITARNLELRIPGEGLPPYMYNDIIGKTFTRDVNEGELLKKGDWQ